MSERFSQDILQFVGRAEYQPVKGRRLAHMMGIPADDYGDFRRSLQTLLEQGRLSVGGGGTVRSPAAPRGITGVFRANRRGFGFVIPNAPPSGHSSRDQAEDIFIPPGASLDAQTGDTVVCRVVRRSRRDGKSASSGQIIAILARGQTQFVGQLQQLHGRWLVQPEGNRLHEPIHVEDVGAKGAREGDQVVAEIVQYPAPGRHATGVITERLGPRGKPGVDVVSMIRQHGLPDVFSEEALAEAGRVAREFDADAELAERTDLRGELTITIDPVDARDFDDAITLRRLAPDSSSASDAGVMRRGKSRQKAAAPDQEAVWELGVHIADVSHFVREGTPLDAESRQRGTSVYFPRHVIPMLPEIISNGVCSLQEGQPRLCKSAFIRYDAQGRVTGTRFANTVIRSSKRLTYEQASSALAGDAQGVSPDVVQWLHEAEQLARVIRSRRIRDGMLVLDLPEVEFVLDDDGRVVDARPADASFSHTIIEMFMVEANEAVARFLTSAGASFLRRVHSPPDPDAVINLSRFLRSLNLHLPRQPTHKDYQRLLAEVRGKPEAQTVNMAVLRSMAQAVYAPVQEGHFALASDDYCHFTSPIRRYPDLHVHRLFDGLVRGRSGRSSRAPRKHRQSSRATDYVPSGAMSVTELGRHCSLVERRAEEAERELRLVKVLELLARQPGEAFRGVISGVAQFGVFVRHPRFLIDGLIEVIDLPPDRWELDESRSVLRGLRTGRRFRIGTEVDVAIARVDVPTRRLALSLVDQGAPVRADSIDADMARRPRKPRRPEPRRHRRQRRR